MNAMVVKEMLELIEIGLRSSAKSEKHSCLYRLACNFNLLVGSHTIKLDEIKRAARGSNGQDSLRIEMKSLLLNFNKDTKQKIKQATQETQQKINFELENAAAIFAIEYRNLQLKYMNSMFSEDLKKIVGKDKDDLFTRFKMFKSMLNN